MGLVIFILVVFQVLSAFNRLKLPYPPDTKREDEDTEVESTNEKPAPSPGKSKIHIS